MWIHALTLLKIPEWQRRNAPQDGPRPASVQTSIPTNPPMRIPSNNAHVLVHIVSEGGSILERDILVRGPGCVPHRFGPLDRLIEVVSCDGGAGGGAFDFVASA